jgi:geranylgeranyl diphosphate synthase type I
MIKMGEAGAILAGDTLYSKAFEILSKVENEPARVFEVYGYPFKDLH